MANGNNRINNFKIGTIIAFLGAIRSQPNTCILRINFKTGLHISTLAILRDTLLRKGYIEKNEVNGRRSDLIITEKGHKLLYILKELRKR